MNWVHVVEFLAVVAIASASVMAVLAQIAMDKAQRGEPVDHIETEPHPGDDRAAPPIH